jgi:hypothetical protein
MTFLEHLVQQLPSMRVIAALVICMSAFPLSAAEPDVAITAVVKARELVFDEVPNVTVTFIGPAENGTVWKTDRENLPDKVQPKVIYRDIGIRLTISSTLANIEQIVDEALAAPPKSAAEGGGATQKPKRKARRSRR